MMASTTEDSLQYQYLSKKFLHNVLSAIRVLKMFKKSYLKGLSMRINKIGLSTQLSSAYKHIIINNPLKPNRNDMNSMDIIQKNNKLRE